MRKNLKMIGIVLLSLLIVWALFVKIDCIRLAIVQVEEAKPLITINTQEYEKDYEYGIIYTGLGYSIKYYNSKNTFAYGTELKLFGILTVWFSEAQ